MRALLFAVLFIPSIVLGQDIPKKVNYIVVESDSVDIIKVGKMLMDAGFTIEKSDKDLGYIHTEYKPIKLSEIKLSVSVSGNRVYIQGKMKTDLGESRIQNTGMKGSPMKIAFDEMSSFANLINGITTYEIK